MKTNKNMKMYIILNILNINLSIDIFKYLIVIFNYMNIKNNKIIITYALFNDDIK